MIKRHRLLAVLLTGTIGTCLVSACHLSQENFSINTYSPLGTYNVRLEGKTDPAKPLPWDLYVQTVRLETFKGAQKLVADPGFFREDSTDGLFRQRFPSYEWLTDQVFR